MPDQPTWVPGEDNTFTRCCTTLTTLDSEEPSIKRWYEGEIDCASMSHPKPKGYGVYMEFE